MVLLPKVSEKDDLSSVRCAWKVRVKIGTYHHRGNMDMASI